MPERVAYDIKCKCGHLACVPELSASKVLANSRQCEMKFAKLLSQNSRVKNLTLPTVQCALQFQHSCYFVVFLSAGHSHSLTISSHEVIK